MTEKAAMDMTMNDGFQEEGGAAGKWQRAILTSTQLSTYYVGSIPSSLVRRIHQHVRATQRDRMSEVLSAVNLHKQQKKRQ